MRSFREFLYLDNAAVDRFANDGVAPSDPSRTLSQASTGQEFRELWHEIRDSGDDNFFTDKEDVDTTWESAAELRFCEFTGQLSIPTIVGVISAADELRNFLNLGQQIGFLPISGNEDDMLSKLGALRDILRETFPVLMTVSESGMKIVLRLDREHSKVGMDRFRGRATVYGRVIELIPKGEKRDVLEIPGSAHIPHMTRQQRRAAERSERNNPTTNQDDMSVQGPAIVLRALAVEQ